MSILDLHSARAVATASNPDLHKLTEHVTFRSKMKLALVRTLVRTF